MFPDVSSLEHKKVPVVKKKQKNVEMISFNYYKCANKKKSYRGGGNRMNLSDKQGRQKCCF